MATVLLVIALLATEFSSRQQPRAKRMVAVSVAEPKRPCAKAVLRDWVEDGQIDRNYAKRCYAAAMTMAPEDGPHVALLDAIKEKLAYAPY